MRFVQSINLTCLACFRHLNKSCNFLILCITHFLKIDDPQNFVTMVKSYKGVIVEKEKSTAQSVKVEDYMSRKLITFQPDQSMSEVIETLLKKRISGAPVVDDQNNLVGVISEGDCMKEVVRGKYNNSPNMSGKVSEHMSTSVIHITPETNIFDAAKMFLEKRIRRFPVVHMGKLIGQISQKDVMRAMHDMKSSTW